jgi:hypothetical protein
MALGSFATGALRDVTVADVRRMLELDETLFVEHKGGLGEGQSSYQVASAIAAFANTQGGWVLLGAEKGKLRGRYADWAPSGTPMLGDAVRDRLRTRVDPLPTFETELVALDDGNEVGVVRVYTSSDTPHLMLDSGAVYVRQGAGKSNARKYETATIGSRAELLELAQRGAHARERVQALIDPGNGGAVAPLIGLEFQQVTSTAHALKPETLEGVYVLAAPYTLPPRFRGWATSHGATEAVAAAASQVARAGDYAPDGWVESHVGGCSIEVQRPLDQVRDGVGGELQGLIKAAVSNEGVVGVSMSLRPRGADEPRTELLTPENFAAAYIEPVVAAALDLLARGEFLGRVLARVEIIRAGGALVIDAPRPVARRLVHDDDLTVPHTDDELTAAALRVANALARTGGAKAWDSVV